MRIYDYDTFLKQKEKVIKIKLKKWADVSNKTAYNKDYTYWGKKIDVTYEMYNSYIIDNDCDIYITIPSPSSFYNKVEYVETNSGLEIE